MEPVQQLLVSIVGGVEGAVFTALLAYVLLTHFASDMDLRSLSLLAVAFMAIVGGQFVFTFGQTGVGRTLLPWLVSYEGLRLLTLAMYLVAAVGLAGFLRTLRRQLEE